MKTWKPGMTAEEERDIAYWERNMLALLMASSMSKFPTPEGKPAAGWYKHQGEGFEGWSRIISFYGGGATFHVPDDFNLGDLPEIEPDWDGHTTEQKWGLIANLCRCKPLTVL